ncbi:cell wall-binding repeat-containing protein [Thermaerobacter sp. FW80]|uniref:cell wall-binding repeat-containing protein n=1 Tax=Thermaerobacter sp. FW80 TaxID=2546351 RepID=UPI001074C2D4|nr:cell wall-binding repeat-containing protein [Thermaerobacter sp. FW80]QBS38249.1 cell wall-binding repeat-containing protein [Thermaerobacter sp. FW80]
MPMPDVAGQEGHLEQAKAPRCLPLAADTHHTTRVAGRHPIATSVAASQTAFPDPSVPELRPGVAILARGDEDHFQDALVASPLMHHPRNGPILLTLPDELDPLVRDELLRLRPPGVGAQPGHGTAPGAAEQAGTPAGMVAEGTDSGPLPELEPAPAPGPAEGTHQGPVQVFLVGDLSHAVEHQVRRLGFRSLRLRGRNVFETAAQVAQFVGVGRTVVVVSGEEFAEGLAAAAWSAHTGQPILLTRRDTLPLATARVIALARNPNVYIVGSERTVSREVERAIRGLTTGLVHRISGASPFAISVELSRFLSPAGDFGWGKTEPAGHFFRFSAVDAWQSAIAGNLFSHLASHAPLLLVERGQVPDVVRTYILSVNPRHTEPAPPFMHGYIVGPPGEVACRVQFELEVLLRTVIE